MPRNTHVYQENEELIDEVDEVEINDEVDSESILKLKLKQTNSFLLALLFL